MRGRLRTFRLRSPGLLGVGQLPVVLEVAFLMVLLWFLLELTLEGKYLGKMNLETQSLEDWLAHNSLSDFSFPQKKIKEIKESPLKFPEVS